MQAGILLDALERLHPHMLADHGNSRRMDTPEQEARCLSCGRKSKDCIRLSIAEPVAQKGGLLWSGELDGKILAILRRCHLSLL